MRASKERPKDVALTTGTGVRDTGLDDLILTINRSVIMKRNKNSQRVLRNPYADHPLMQKGGRHEKSNKAKRRADKVAFKKEWGEEINRGGLFPHSIHNGLVA